MPLDRIGGPQAGTPLTGDQQHALKKLHDAAQQMESLFVGMLFKEMRKSESHVSLTGKTSNAEETFRDMLDEKRSEALAKTGSLGIGKIVEQQLRASVLGGSAPAGRTELPKERQT
jgi:Rod binding domain-containing protein